MIRISQTARLWAFLVLAMLVPATLSAAPFAAYVIDARTGQPIYKQNEDTRLHPASLTKMMTLYMAFTAVERGQVRLDSQFPFPQSVSGPPANISGTQKFESASFNRQARVPVPYTRPQVIPR